MDRSNLVIYYFASHLDFVLKMEVEIVLLGFLEFPEGFFNGTKKWTGAS